MTFLFKHFISIVLTIFFSVSIYAQQHDDASKLNEKLKNYLDKSELEFEQKNYFETINQLSKAKSVAETLEHENYMGYIYTKLGEVYFIINDFSKSEELLNKAIEIQTKLSDGINLIASYKWLGLIRLTESKPEEALSLFYKAEKYVTNVDIERTKLSSEIFLLKAKTLNELDRYEEAQVVLEKLELVAELNNFYSILSGINIQKAYILEQYGSIDEALDLLFISLQIAEKHNNVILISESALQISKLYAVKKDFKSQYKYYDIYIKLTDSLQNINRANLKYGVSQVALNKYKDDKLEGLNSEMIEVNAESNFARITTVLSIVLIIILSLLTLSLYKNNNIRLKTNTMLQKKNEQLFQAKKNAEQASRSKANFLSTVTHELRTPLYAVTGLTNMLLDENPQKHQIQHLKSLKFSGEYLLTFINDILQINKIEANKVELDPEVFNLKVKIQNVIAALEQTAQDNNTTLSFSYSNELSDYYEGDQLKISQILINLLGNAIKFTENGEVSIKANLLKDENNDTHVINFEVIDNGIGISTEKQELLFESFSQGSVQINRKYGGTGLGLSIVKGLIGILNGEISFKSTLGKGSTFFFNVPLIKKTAADKDNTVNEVKKKLLELDMTNVKILIVEDNKINQMITKKILTKMGISTDIVDNGEDSIDKVKEEDYNIILMDIHMPGISGIEATRRIREFNKDITIFALTAVTLEDKMYEFGEAGFTDIISKPFKQEVFESKLYDVLTGKKIVSSYF